MTTFQQVNKFQAPCKMYIVVIFALFLQPISACPISRLLARSLTRIHTYKYTHSLAHLHSLRLTQFSLLHRILSHLPSLSLPILLSPFFLRARIPLPYLAHPPTPLAHPLLLLLLLVPPASLSSLYTTQSKTRRWPMSCFLGILDMATVNASIVCEEVRKTAGRSPTNRAFIMDVAKSLMRPWCVLRL